MATTHTARPSHRWVCDWVSGLLLRLCDIDRCVSGDHEDQSLFGWILSTLSIACQAALLLDD
jgi:hypothetical protein